MKDESNMILIFNSQITLLSSIGQPLAINLRIIRIFEREKREEKNEKSVLFLTP